MDNLTIVLMITMQITATFYHYFSTYFEKKFVFD